MVTGVPDDLIVGDSVPKAIVLQLAPDFPACFLARPAEVFRRFVENGERETNGIAPATKLALDPFPLRAAVIVSHSEPSAGLV